MRIGDLARTVGIRTSAIRYYEEFGLLRRPPRAAGQRVYRDADVAILRLILGASDGGFTLLEIKRLLPLFHVGHVGRDRWNALAKNKLAELAARISALEAMQSRLRRALACECAGDVTTCTLAADVQSPGAGDRRGQQPRRRTSRTTRTAS